MRLLEILITSQSFIPLLYHMCKISEMLAIHVVDFVFWVAHQQQLLPYFNSFNSQQLSMLISNYQLTETCKQKLLFLQSLN